MQLPSLSLSPARAPSCLPSKEHLGSHLEYFFLFIQGCTGMRRNHILPKFFYSLYGKIYSMKTVAVPTYVQLYPVLRIQVTSMWIRSDFSRWCGSGNQHLFLPSLTVYLVGTVGTYPVCWVKIFLSLGLDQLLIIIWMKNKFGIQVDRKSWTPLTLSIFGPQILWSPSQEVQQESGRRRAGGNSQSGWFLFIIKETFL